MNAQAQRRVSAPRRATDPDGPPRVLLADDQPDVITALRLLLTRHGFAVESADSPAAVREAVAHRDFDALLIDLNYARDTTSGHEGLDLLASLKAYDELLPIVVMTAWSSLDVTVEAMRRGARDFVQKPWDNARLMATLRSAVDLGRALRQSRRLEAENRLLRSSLSGTPLITASPAMQAVVEMIERIGPSDASVLITGENGTGKGVVAGALHAASRRAARSFVTVNVGALPETVFESELFGHVKGAFTDARADRIGRFELADRGTLFLDEIGNVAPAQQSRLLRVLETGEFEPVGSSATRRVDVRVVSATNTNLSEAVKAGAFRQDLFFRLRTVEIHLPPLRERRSDIPPLAGSFLSTYVARYRKAIEGFHERAVAALLEHSWPGNVRELDHAVERAVLMATGRTITAADLALAMPAPPAGEIDSMTLDQMEALMIRKALVRFGGNADRAAESLGLSRSAMYRRMQRHGL